MLEIGTEVILKKNGKSGRVVDKWSPHKVSPVVFKEDAPEGYIVVTDDGIHHICLEYDLMTKEHKNMFKVSKKKWDSIPADYKGEWQDYYDEHPEWLGKRVVMSGCITENPNELGKLLVEDVHFIIEE